MSRDFRIESIKQKEIEIEAKQNEHEFTKEQFIQHIAVQNVIISFERIFNSIFRSQVDLLWVFQENKITGLNKSQLETFFSTIKASEPLAYSNWAWQNYISFLIQNNLIHLSDNGNFVITEYGSAFLEYITSMSYQKFTPL